MERRAGGAGGRLPRQLRQAPPARARRRGELEYFEVNYASLRRPNNVSGVYLAHVTLLLMGQQGMGYFFRYRPLLPIGWSIVQILRQRWRKTTNIAPTPLSTIQAASQSTFINTQLYSTCDKQEWQK